MEIAIEKIVKELVVINDSVENFDYTNVIEIEHYYELVHNAEIAVVIKHVSTQTNLLCVNLHRKVDMDY